jgi:L-seryl-tRNA(Ser) seleniumtransferase
MVWIINRRIILRNYIYDKLNITPMINAAGTYTMVGGSRMSEKTLKDMAEASRAHVDIKELQTTVNQRLAELTNNEAACVCNGAASGLYLAAATCVAKKAGKPFNFLSMSEIGDYEILMFSAHRNPYDWSIRQLGVKLKEIGYPNTIYVANSDDLRNSINHKTAGIFFMFSNPGGWIAEGGMDIESTIKVAKEKEIPVIIDAAAQVPPVENLWRLTQAGATAALFSGGKDLRGPQSSGLIVGKKDFLATFTEINFFNYGIGRMLKIGREEIVGLLSAVEQYVNMDHSKRNEWVEKQIQVLIDFSGSSKLFNIVRAFPNEAGQPMPRAEILLKISDITLEQISKFLRDGSPSIFTFVDRGHLFINPMTLFEGETEEIINRLKKMEIEFNEL